MHGAWGRRLEQLSGLGLPKACQRVHLFYAGPAALAFILGSNSGGLPSLQLYEHDFDGMIVDDHYYPTLTLPLGAG